MQRSIRRKLIELNLDLYHRFAEEYSTSRARLQPGILRALSSLGEFSSLVDIGCGDARVGRALRAGKTGTSAVAWNGRYVGVDACDALLDLAPEAEANFQLIRADLTQEDWTGAIPRSTEGFEAMVLFSSLHHIPGAEERLRFLQECATLLAENGRWVISVWQFLHLERFRSRVLPWSRIGLSEDELEPGDVLHDWRRGGNALRYVHSFELKELRNLCEAAGLIAEEHYRSDGETGDLGLYLLGRRR